jgi:GxxExxY protein
MSETPSNPSKDPRTFAILGAAFEVHRELGPGFLEVVYHEALALEFDSRGMGHRREVMVPVSYKGICLNASYRVDFVCFDSVIVEIKAVPRLGRSDEAQLINYLKAGGYRTGLLLNFGTRSLEYARYVL